METSQKMSETNENMTNQITMEEHFVQPEQAKKDPNAVYIEDNPQKALDKLIHLGSMDNYLEKIQYVKHLAELMAIIGDQGVANLKDIINLIQKDTDEVKRAFLTQISPLVAYLQTRTNGYKEIIDTIVPVVSYLMNSTNNDIKEEAGQELAKLAPLLNEEDRGSHILKVVLEMAHDDENEQNRILAIRLLSEMAHLFGKDLCEQFVGLEFLSMGEDSQMRMRREIASNLPSVSRVVSSHFFRQRLLNFYLKLCKDAVWSVRKACIDILYEISNICKDESIEIRENELTEAMNSFLNDSNKWVKISAYKNLGPFIYTLQDRTINEQLINAYIHMVDNNVNNLSPDNEIIYACSYNFPAVVLTLGPSRWPLLSKLFQALLKTNDRVRKPLACSLHEIAKIIGEEQTEKDLLSVLETFLKDPNDDIKYGALQHLALFLEVFSVEKRENMVDIFVQVQDSQRKWRVRELIARQIDKLTSIFSPKITFEILAPISIKLCNDPVSFVREEAAKKIYAVFNALSHSDEVYRNSITTGIQGFSMSNRFTNRQSFVLMCEKLMKNSESFMDNFYSFFAPLSEDKVTNVRISVAKTLEKIFKKKRDICQRQEILELVVKLRNDSSFDVRNIIENTIKEHLIEDQLHNIPIVNFGKNKQSFMNGEEAKTNDSKIEESNKIIEEKLIEQGNSDKLEEEKFEEDNAMVVESKEDSENIIETENKVIEQIPEEATESGNVSIQSDMELEKH